MQILISIFFGLILIFLTSSLKINLKYLEKGKNSIHIKFNVNIGIYLLGVVKIFGISLKEDGVHFLLFKIPYNIVKIDKDSMKVIKDISVKDVLKSLHLKLEKFYFDLKIGCDNVFIVVFSVFIISTFLSFVLAQNKKNKNYFYQISPVYNTNTVYFYGSLKISISFVNIAKTLLHFKKYEKSPKGKYFTHFKNIPINL